MQEMKRRQASIQSMIQMTKAMQLIATVQLQKSKKELLQRTEYTNAVRTFFHDAIIRTEQLQLQSTLLRKSFGQVKTEHQRELLLVFSSDQGLAGGYHVNLVQKITQKIQRETAICYCMGKKAKMMLEKKGYVVREGEAKTAKQLADQILEWFVTEPITQIRLAYTKFKNTLVQIPQIEQIFPQPFGAERGNVFSLIEYEEGTEHSLKKVVRLYLEELLQMAELSSKTSEYAARMQAMDTACTNAKKGLDELQLYYHQARQSAITQQLTELVAGVEAMQEG